MFKHIILFSIVMLWLSTTFAAQTGLNFQNPQPTTQPGTPVPPADFANQVKTVNTQKHTQFKQQLDQQKSALSHPQIPSLSQVQSMSQTPPPAITSEPELNNEITTSNNKLKPNKSTSINTVTSQENMQQPISSSPPPNGAPPLPSKPSQSQPYMGFPTQSQQNSSGASKNSGGFHIQY